ncbi:MAG: AfsR/SARP family transcriptional regulator [Emergencia timonensis]|uniref:AfsR/SARP family transcriptional regulator n=1 Tax=Emergencia timonensis TaxID=1776384 RepID=UPI00082FB06D|nr:BTAD domain-containing putative transcriptional regulator [Emergencia timonensis]WNX87582.1 BTAD domain-containing putative transcriptional regulator [Emergencia timonensis]
MEIKIYLLQRPHIEIDGKEAFTKLNNKAFAMVLYLASKQGQAVSKEVLSEIFWPQQQEENARSNLRQNLSYIKKICTEELANLCTEEVSIISSERNVCGLNENLDIKVDLIEFWANLRAGYRADDLETKTSLLQSAADAYQGSVLGGVYVRGSAAFEEWLMFEREAVNQNLVRVCKDLAAIYQKKDLTEKAITCLKKLLQMDPLLEEVHLELMKLYYQNKERAKAICQYKECVRILGEELNISPMEETRAFYQKISEEASELIFQQTALEDQKQSRLLLLPSSSPAPMEYEGIYALLESVVEDGSLVPDYLKRGLAILFPQYSDKLDGQNLPEIYLFYTIKKLLEYLGEKGKLTIQAEDAECLDSKTKQLITYLSNHLDHPNIEIIF